jgi:hypothetical protein
MNRNRVRQIALGIVLAALCAGPAQAQFNKFVVVGDSLAAGEESNCVVERFQQRSWARLVAGLLQQDFQQPLFAEEQATNPPTGYPCYGPIVSGASISVGVVSQQGPNQNIQLGRPYDNLGTNGSPHIRDFVDLKTTVPGRSDLDNKAAAIWRNCTGCPFEGMSAVDEANSLAPDLVGFWGGNNDALDALGAGAGIEGVTLTPIPLFTAKYEEVIEGLTAPGRTLVVFNIPDIRSVPFVTTIPPVVVDPATRQPVLINGQPVPLLGPGDAAFPCDPLPPDQGCALPPGTLVSLLAQPYLEAGVGIPRALGGSGQPLPHGTFTPPATFTPGVILYPDDVTAIQEHVDGYNAAIAASASANGAILIDMHSIFDQAAAQGYTIGGVTVTTSFLTGGIFSYDGVHPSAIGYGIIADEFVKALNAAKGTSIPRPNFSQILFTPNVPPVPPPAPVVARVEHATRTVSRGSGAE